MTSLPVNAASASALSRLRATALAVDKTDTRLATGKAVGAAEDNAAYWSIATTMKSDSLSMASAEDATGLSAAVADSAALGLDQATGLVSDIRSKLILAQAAGANRSVINSEISALKDQLGVVADSAAFNGQNWLSLDGGQSPKVTSMVSSVGSDGDGNLSVNVTSFDTAQSVLTSRNDAADGLLTRANLGIASDGSAYEYYLMAVGSATPAPASAREITIGDTTTPSEIKGMLAATGTILSGLTDARAAVGATQSRMAASTDFLGDLKDVTTVGIGRLVDADLEGESTRLASLKVQAQLQSAGLAIANSQQQSILQLFR